MNVREIIREATVRINLVPRRQAVPGDILESAFRLLKGVVNKYNYDNLLSFTQNSVDSPLAEYTHIYDETDYLKGDNNMYFATVEELEAYTPSEEDYDNNVMAMVYGSDQTVYSVVQVGTPAGNVYVWAAHDIILPENQRIQQMKLYMRCRHLNVKNVAKINSIYLESGNLHYELRFVPANKFDAYTNDSDVYTVVQKSEGEWLVRVKPYVATLGYKMSINFNEGIEFDLDDDLFIPDNYTELLIVALAHKLALQYPRLDDTQMSRLETEVKVLVDNVRTPKAITREVKREDYDYGAKTRLTQNQLLCGIL